mgnify:CR=1 FL=1
MSGVLLNGLDTGFEQGVDFAEEINFSLFGGETSGEFFVFGGEFEELFFGGAGLLDEMKFNC